MKLQTLFYIKKMLEHECEVMKETCENITKQIREREKELNITSWEDPEDEVLKQMRMQKAIAHNRWRDAEEALEDFMSQRWGTER